MLRQIFDWAGRLRLREPPAARKTAIWRDRASSPRRLPKRLQTIAIVLSTISALRDSRQRMWNVKPQRPGTSSKSTPVASSWHFARGNRRHSSSSFSSALTCMSNEATPWAEAAASNVSAE